MKNDGGSFMPPIGIEAGFADVRAAYDDPAPLIEAFTVAAWRPRPGQVRLADSLLGMHERLLDLDDRADEHVRTEVAPVATCRPSPNSGANRPAWP